LGNYPESKHNRIINLQPNPYNKVKKYHEIANEKLERGKKVERLRFKKYPSWLEIDACGSEEG